jgi:hypothetical protein
VTWNKVGGFYSSELWFPTPIKHTAMIYLATAILLKVELNTNNITLCFLQTRKK